MALPPEGAAEDHIAKHQLMAVGFLTGCHKRTIPQENHHLCQLKKVVWLLTIPREMGGQNGKTF